MFVRFFIRGWGFCSFLFFNVEGSFFFFWYIYLGMTLRDFVFFGVIFSFFFRVFCFLVRIVGNVLILCKVYISIVFRFVFFLLIIKWRILELLLFFLIYEDLLVVVGEKGKVCFWVGKGVLYRVR